MYDKINREKLIKIIQQKNNKFKEFKKIYDINKKLLKNCLNSDKDKNLKQASYRLINDNDTKDNNKVRGPRIKYVKDKNIIDNVKIEDIKTEDNNMVKMEDIKTEINNIVNPFSILRNVVRNTDKKVDKNVEKKVRKIRNKKDKKENIIDDNNKDNKNKNINNITLNPEIKINTIKNTNSLNNDNKDKKNNNINDNTMTDEDYEKQVIDKFTEHQKFVELSKKTLYKLMKDRIKPLINFNDFSSVFTKIVFKKYLNALKKNEKVDFVSIIKNIKLNDFKTEDIKSEIKNRIDNRRKIFSSINSNKNPNDKDTINNETNNKDIINKKRVDFNRNLFSSDSDGELINKKRVDINRNLFSSNNSDGELINKKTINPFSILRNVVRNTDKKKNVDKKVDKKKNVDKKVRKIRNKKEKKDNILDDEINKIGIADYKDVIGMFGGDKEKKQKELKFMKEVLENEADPERIELKKKIQGNSISKDEYYKQLQQYHNKGFRYQPLKLNENEANSYLLLNQKLNITDNEEKNAKNDLDLINGFKTYLNNTFKIGKLKEKNNPFNNNNNNNKNIVYQDVSNLIRRK